jgi:FkbM family methyltransferase
MNHLIAKIKRRFNHYYKLIVLKDPSAIALNKWFADKGDTTLRLNYPLTENSVVLDVGGYRGNWAEQIIQKYNPYIFIFEPVTDYYNIIVNKFENNPKVKVYNFGLSDADKIQKISLREEASSTYSSSQNDDYIEIKLRNIQDVLITENIERIDLMKVNIEGGEYPLIQYTIEQSLIDRFKNIQIQFHDFFPDAKEWRQKLQTLLQQTHSLTYEYPFCWENWERKSN